MSFNTKISAAFKHEDKAESIPDYTKTWVPHRFAFEVTCITLLCAVSPGNYCRKLRDCLQYHAQAFR
jgi:hypothetical protein